MMKKLVLSALFIGGLAQLTGCIFVSEDSNEGNLDVAWNLTAGDNDELLAECPGALSSANVISVNDSTGERFIDRFDCVNGGGITADLPAGTYTVAVDILDEADSAVAISFSQAAVIEADATRQLDFDIAVDGGFLGLTWSLTDDARDLTCQDVLGTDITVFSVPIGAGGPALQDVFDCTDLGGVTGKLAIDQYTVTVSLFDANANNLGDSVPREVQIALGNELVDLGNFEFVFAP